MMTGQKIMWFIVLVCWFSTNNAAGEWVIDRNMILPTFRTIPNDTHGSLQHHFNGDWAHLCLVNGQPLVGEKVETVSLSGVMTVKSIYGNRGVSLTRTLFPSTSQPAFCEKYELENVTENSLTVEFPTNILSYHTDEAKGVEGSYTLTATLSSPLKEGTFQLKAGEKAWFQVIYAGYKKNGRVLALDVDKELVARREFLRQVQGNLVLETPSDVINTMFSFAKIRGSESIFDTKGGYMQSPGGEAYYAAIWANDQAEYINPFFIQSMTIIFPPRDGYRTPKHNVPHHKRPSPHLHGRPPRQSNLFPLQL